MKFIEHDLGSSVTVEVVSDEVLINAEQDALNLMAKIGYQYDSRKIILHKENLYDEFYVLSSGNSMPGLQVQLCKSSQIIGFKLPSLVISTLHLHTIYYCYEI